MNNKDGEFKISTLSCSWLDSTSTYTYVQTNVRDLERKEHLCIVYHSIGERRNKFTAICVNV